MSWDNPSGASASGWGASVAAAPDTSWNAGDTGAGANWGPSAPAEDKWGAGGESGGNNGLSESNVSKHANGDFVADGGGDDGCRNCGNTGHFARDCPDPRKQSGDCFNCGQPGHSKADCPNPRVFTGTCHICSKEGHPASECPDKPPEICKNCKKEGHKALVCKENRVLDLSKVANKSPDDAWDALKVADASRDLDDFREAILVYAKAVPGTTYDQLERSFRLHSFNTYLIAYEKELPITQTFIDLQGKLDCTYQIGYYFSPKPKRTNAAQGWPSSPEENMERLKDAGIPMDRGIPKCNNCNDLGHSAKFCKEDKAGVERVEVKCVNCDETGHRARDCTKARTDRFACRNCKQSGHTAAECPEPRSAEGVECKKCNEVGHFAKDCPTGGNSACRNCGEEGHISKECDKPRNPATVTCRNCDKMGHFSKECPEPKDWSKVKCTNCGEMGHTIKRCKQPVPGEDGAGNEGFGGTNSFGNDTGNGASSRTVEPTGDWTTTTPADAGASASGWGIAAPIASTGGW
ncbi:hypothetical protein MMC08_006105 [Hypocenomyce scalaris]|nr:hypothetical protein [Hypocenomyce scalaris]